VAKNWPVLRYGNRGASGNREPMFILGTSILRAYTNVSGRFRGRHRATTARTNQSELRVRRCGSVKYRAAASRRSRSSVLASATGGNASHLKEALQAGETIAYEVEPGTLPTTLPDGFWYRCLSGDVDNCIINGLVAYSLGYVFDGERDVWETEYVPKEWLQAFPDGAPPDFIGSSKNHAREADEPVKRAIQKLQQSLPKEYRQFLQRRLPQFHGYQISELTPEKTRRAQCINYLLARIDMQEKGLPH